MWQRPGEAPPTVVIWWGGCNGEVWEEEKGHIRHRKECIPEEVFCARLLFFFLLGLEPAIKLVQAQGDPLVIKGRVEE